MKPQDLIFLVILVLILALRRPIYFLYTGLICLVLAIPLFAFWIFFTAQRLTWYAGAFFLLFLLFSLHRPHKVQ